VLDVFRLANQLIERGPHLVAVELSAEFNVYAVGSIWYYSEHEIPPYFFSRGLISSIPHDFGFICTGASCGSSEIAIGYQKLMNIRLASFWYLS
jgi:hypothetical protein